MLIFFKISLLNDGWLYKISSIWLSKSTCNLRYYKPSDQTSKTLLFLLFNDKFKLSSVSADIYNLFLSYYTLILKYGVASNLRIDSTTSHYIAALLQTTIMSPLHYFSYLFIKNMFHWNYIYQQKPAQILYIFRSQPFHCEHSEGPSLSPPVTNYPNLTITQVYHSS